MLLHDRIDWLCEKLRRVYFTPVLLLGLGFNQWLLLSHLKWDPLIFLTTIFFSFGGGLVLTPILAYLSKRNLFGLRDLLPWCILFFGAFQFMFAALVFLITRSGMEMSEIKCTFLSFLMLIGGGVVIILASIKPDKSILEF